MTSKRQITPAPRTKIARPPPLAVAAQLQEALTWHQQGRLADADAAYRKILQHQPEHFDALHLRGVIALQNHQTQAGVELIQQAVAVDPGNPFARSNLGRGYQELGRPLEALASFDQALLLDPG
jgi:protein O-GlcNAc transferase